MQISFKIPPQIRLQMLQGAANKQRPYEIRAEAAKTLLDGCYVDTIEQALAYCNSWYECLTFTDTLAIS